MGTVKVVDILAEARRILVDAGATRWTNAELLGWYNAALREIVTIRPDAKTVSASLVCVAGSRQTLPSTALRLLSVVRNVNGPAIAQIERRVLDEQLPGWHTRTGAYVQHYVYDPLEPRAFYVFPVPAEGHQIQVVYAAPPTAVTSATTDLSDIAGALIELDDVYANPALDYVLMRAFMKDSDLPAGAARSATHANLFQQSLGLKVQSDVSVAPRPAYPNARPK